MRLLPKLMLYAVALATILVGVLSTLDYIFTGEKIEAGDLVAEFIEILVLSTAMVVSANFVGRLRGLEDETSEMKLELSAASEAGRAWRAQSDHLLQGLSAAIAAQFEAWGLTEAEAEIASLILKGASLKDVAVLRRTSEGTIRQQAQSIYRKSGLNNRSELSAYFLEDLFDVASARSSLINTDVSKH